MGESTLLRRIETALISVANKQQLVGYAQYLQSAGITIISTGGTYSTLKGAGLNPRSLTDYVMVPEILDGRVKTLQPEIFAGILAKREEAHLGQLREYGVGTIDMVVCNFYPFEEALKNEARLDVLLENIDIGGPSLVRAASKNYEFVAVVPDPRFYDSIIAEMELNNYCLSLKTRAKLAQAAFGIVAAYDVSIYNGLRRFTDPKELFPNMMFISAVKTGDAKYGENIYQKAAVYREVGYPLPWRQLYGDQLSYNNYFDALSALEFLEGFEEVPATAIGKHGHLCGFAFAPTISEAVRLAHECNPEADYGGTFILNQKTDVQAARIIGYDKDIPESVYAEIIIAKAYDPEALEMLKAKQKKKLRILQLDSATPRKDVRYIRNTLLVQEPTDYTIKLDEEKLLCPTKAKPDMATLKKLSAVWEIGRKVYSNAVVIGNGELTHGRLIWFYTVGIGSDVKRSSSAKMATENAGNRAKGAVASSDGFIPFPDSIEILGKAGVSAIIQPGGSIRDREIISEADKYGIAMLFTGIRAFKH